MFKKGFSKFLIIVIVLVVITGGVLAWQYWWSARGEVDIVQIPGGGALPSQDTLDAPEPRPSNESDWMLYTNRVFDYQMEFPEEMLSQDYPSGFSVTEKSNEVLFVLPNPTYTQTGMASSLKVLVLDTTLEESNLPFNEFVSQSVSGFIQQEEVEIGGETAIQLIFNRGTDGRIEIGTEKRTPDGLIDGEPYFGQIITGDHEVVIMRNVNKDNTVFLIMASFQDQDKQEAQDIFSQMLSTFEFLN